MSRYICLYIFCVSSLLKAPAFQFLFHSFSLSPKISIPALLNLPTKKKKHFTIIVFPQSTQKINLFFTIITSFLEFAWDRVLPSRNPKFQEIFENFLLGQIAEHEECSPTLWSSLGLLIVFRFSLIFMNTSQIPQNVLSNFQRNPTHLNLINFPEKIGRISVNKSKI